MSDFVVSGCGMPQFNGTYRPQPGAKQRDGWSRPYGQVGGSGTIEYYSGGVWWLTEGYASNTHYRCVSTSSTPPLTEWYVVGRGTAPAPSLSPATPAAQKAEGAPIATVIADALLVNSALTDLNLAFNELGVEGAKLGVSIGEALRVNSVLKSLDLRGVSGQPGIGPAGAKAIAEALRVNGSLTSLDLVYHAIGEGGAKAIADALHVNSVLTSLSLGDGNQIGDGKAALLEIAKGRPSLTLELCHDRGWN